MDAFLDMLPAHLDGTAAGVVFEPVTLDGTPAMAVRSGPVAARLLDGMRHAVAAMAARGNNLIVDDVLLDGAAAEYDRLLAGVDLCRVAVDAPLAVLETRERARGDRLAGLARWQVDRVHRGIDYDLRLDTETATPEECARRIRDAFGL